MMRSRDGFTLVEMLAASVIFLIGFVSVYGLFLGAMRFRQQGENLTRSAIAASSLTAELRLRMPFHPTSAPADFQGDGLPSNNPDTANAFFHYSDQPGLFYRVADVAYLVDPGSGPVLTRALTMNLQFVFLGIGELEQDEGQILRRFGRPNQTIQALIDSGQILEYPTVIFRP